MHGWPNALLSRDDGLRAFEGHHADVVRSTETLHAFPTNASDLGLGGGPGAISGFNRNHVELTRTLLYLPY